MAKSEEHEAFMDTCERNDKKWGRYRCYDEIHYRDKLEGMELCTTCNGYRYILSTDSR